MARTPLFDEHLSLGARIIDFGGWDMPVQYTGIIDEHNCTRTNAGLFDVSHMGEFEVMGPGAEAYLNKLVTNDVSRMKDKQTMYTAMCLKNGGTIDDLIIYRHSEEYYMLVVNASNIEKDWNWCIENADGFDVHIEDISESTALLALQGPNAVKILDQLADVEGIRPFNFNIRALDGTHTLISRTGYTGEDGFEIYLYTQDAVKIWKRLLEIGNGYGIRPAGLGARDTLRLEAGLRLYGNDMDEGRTPVEAGIGWTVKVKKECAFNGKEALAKQKAEGTKDKLVGFELMEKGVPRHEQKAFKDGEEVGAVTSGAFSPTLKKPIGFVYLKKEFASEGEEFEIHIRNKYVKARVVRLPFYKR